MEIDKQISLAVPPATTAEFEHACNSLESELMSNMQTTEKQFFLDERAHHVATDNFASQTLTTRLLNQQ